MKKIPCLFQRDFTDRRNPVLLRAVTVGCEWVLAGEGVATQKWDGTAVAIINGKLYARYDAKRGKPIPPGAIPCGEPDPVTGHNPCWVLAAGPEYKWINEAHGGKSYVDGTYEAVGPKINGNHDRLDSHMLAKHGGVMLTVPRDWEGLLYYLAGHDIEGIVFHHPDGRMCKIRRDDYGLPWPIVVAAQSDPRPWSEDCEACRGDGFARDADAMLVTGICTFCKGRKPR